MQNYKECKHQNTNNKSCEDSKPGRLQTLSTNLEVSAASVKGNRDCTEPSVVMLPYLFVFMIFVWLEHRIVRSLH